MNSLDKALYICYRGREWAVWHSPQGELLAIPGDEEPCNDDDIATLFNYLEDEGFFSDYFTTLEHD